MYWSAMPFVDDLLYTEPGVWCAAWEYRDRQRCVRKPAVGIDSTGACGGAQISEVAVAAWSACLLTYLGRVLPAGASRRKRDPWPMRVVCRCVLTFW